jgi:hypothetical protein
MFVKDCVWQMVCDTGGVTKRCVKDGVWKMFVKDCVWQMVCDKDVCDKDVCDRVVCDKDVSAAEAEERDTESKTRTLHKDVGKNSY